MKFRSLCVMSPLPSSDSSTSPSVLGVSNEVSARSVDVSEVESSENASDEASVALAVLEFSLKMSRNGTSPTVDGTTTDVAESMLNDSSGEVRYLTMNRTAVSVFSEISDDVR